MPPFDYSDLEFFLQVIQSDIYGNSENQFFLSPEYIQFCQALDEIFSNSAENEDYSAVGNAGLEPSAPQLEAEIEMPPGLDASFFYSPFEDLDLDINLDDILLELLAENPDATNDDAETGAVAPAQDGLLADELSELVIEPSEVETDSVSKM